VDLLINNAGVVEGRPFLEITPAGLQRTFGVNTFALYWVTRAFLPGMIARGRGHVVTVASASGFVGAVRLADYAASKHAAVGFHESLRLELRRDGHPIRTTLVCPYFIGTGMFDGVKTRFPRLLPILSPDWVADRIVEAIRKERPRLLLPRGVWVVFVARYLPVAWFDWIAERLGLSRAMDGFRGQRSRRD
jgi:all-trans-retinol dehydrogenase (NAD+)